MALLSCSDELSYETIFCKIPIRKSKLNKDNFVLSCPGLVYFNTTSLVMNYNCNVDQCNSVLFVEILLHYTTREKSTKSSVENRARPTARYRVKNDVGGQIRHTARPANG